MALEQVEGVRTIELRQGTSLNLANSYDILEDQKILYRFNARTLDNHILLYMHAKSGEVGSHDVFGVVDYSTVKNGNAVYRLLDEEVARIASERLLERAKLVANRLVQNGKCRLDDLSAEESDYYEKLSPFGRWPVIIP